MAKGCQKNKSTKKKPKIHRQERLQRLAKFNKSRTNRNSSSVAETKQEAVHLQAPENLNIFDNLGLLPRL